MLFTNGRHNRPDEREEGGRMDKACLVKGKKGCCMHEFDLIIIIYPQAMGYKSKV
jgi:hypothetical protein